MKKFRSFEVFEMVDNDINVLLKMFDFLKFFRVLDVVGNGLNELMLLKILILLNLLFNLIFFFFVDFKFVLIIFGEKIWVL